MHACMRTSPLHKHMPAVETRVGTQPSPDDFLVVGHGLERDDVRAMVSCIQREPGRCPETTHSSVSQAV